ncbi:hypothetical protein HY772_06750 [Candidatus Woesearchaeota archaeon]|nr:hypothetical protein [Candidatus Woesearchaeota archaeon]
MSIRNYVGRGLATLALAGSLFLGGCPDPQPPQPQRLEQRISQEVAQPNGQPDKYAILINGTDERRFVMEISLIYQVLLENGFKREDIYVFDQDGKEEFLYPVDDIAHRKSLETIFNHLQKKIDGEDILIVHVSDHGVRTRIKAEGSGSGETQEVTEVVLPYGNVSEIDFERYLSGINPKFGIFSTEVCYGGGLANRLGYGRFVGIAQTTATELGQSIEGNIFGGFFYQAFRNSAESDKNKDGRVTIDEAFDYAKNRHSWSRTGKVNPQLVSDMDVKSLSIK